MGLGDPTRAVTPTLDGPVLAVLARAPRPLTVGEVAARTVRGSEIGVRRCVARLVGQGLVRSTQMGRNAVLELNREHIAAPIGELLAGLGDELRRRIASAISSWDPAPLRAALLTPAAPAGAGPTGSGSGDLALWLVHAPLPGESSQAEAPGTGPADAVRATSTSAGSAEPVASPLPPEVPEMTYEQERAWRAQVRCLQEAVRAWTGNRLLLVEMSTYEEAEHRRRGSRLLDELRSTGIELIGPPLPDDPGPGAAPPVPRTPGSAR